MRPTGVHLVLFLVRRLLLGRLRLRFDLGCLFRFLGILGSDETGSLTGLAFNYLNLVDAIRIVKLVLKELIRTKVLIQLINESLCTEPSPSKMKFTEA